MKRDALDLDSLKVMDAAMKHEKRLVRVHGAASKLREWCPNSCSVVRVHGVLSDSSISRSVVRELATRLQFLVKHHSCVSCVALITNAAHAHQSWQFQYTFTYSDSVRSTRPAYLCKMDATKLACAFCFLKAIHESAAVRR